MIKQFYTIIKRYTYTAIPTYLTFFSLLPNNDIIELRSIITSTIILAFVQKELKKLCDQKLLC